MIRNIVFDFGVILTGVDTKICVAALDKIGLARIGAYIGTSDKTGVCQELELGNISPLEFCQQARDLCDRPDVTDNAIIDAWNTMITGVPVAKLRRLKELRDTGKYRIMMLSNTNMIHWEKSVNDFFTMDGLTVDDYFDRIFLSCKMHLTKPDKAIFERMLEQSGAIADETLFIDDSARNCEVAESLGIHTFYDPTGERFWDGALKVEC